jgi:hypothetical protein
MYVLAPNQVVAVYPYSVDQLKRDNPATSFPAQMSDQDLAAWQVYPVVTQEPPAYDEATENCSQVDPIFSNSKWLMQWQVTDASAEEIQQRTEQKATAIRLERNQRLAECDWTQLADAPVDAAVWATYRQALRDVPDQTGFPWNVTWPMKPV